MCGRINQTDLQMHLDFGGPDGKWEAKLTRSERKKKRANISAGMLADVITPEGWLEAEFGFRPVWDPKKLFINARAEGKGNEANNPIGWEVGIDSMASFRKAFKQSRIVIPVDSFIEGPEKEKLSKPFMIVREDRKPFYLGAVATEYTKADGSPALSFAIITTPANAICSKIGHHRSPLMLREDTLKDWLNADQDPAWVRSIITSGYDEPGLVAFPLNPDLIKSGKLHEEEVLEPIGEMINP